MTVPNGNTIDERKFTYLVGIGVLHSIAPVMHNYIIKSLGYSWNFSATECQTIEAVMDLFRRPDFAGGVVTMPYKTAIIPHLDGIDEYALKIGAVNNVYRAGNSLLRGTNTDWRGIVGCLTGADHEAQKGVGKAALIIGAGGASRAALYALHEELGCNPVYVVNRDEAEVQALFKDAQTYGAGLEIVHVQSVKQAEELMRRSAPHYIVGTVPDFEPRSETELEMRDILKTFLSGEEKGVLLDMCFKPRRTRTLKMGEACGWTTVEGTGIIGHQIEEQYRLWCGEADGKRVPKEEAWAVLRKAAEESTAINF